MADDKTEAPVTATTASTAPEEPQEAAPPSSNGASAAAKNKRGADASWRGSKDEEEEDGSMSDDGGSGAGVFQRADAETLSKRRIVKARRPPGAQDEAAAVPSSAGAPAAANPFANVSLTAEQPKPSAAGGGVFGSKFGHVNAASILAGRPSAFPAPGSGVGFGGGAAAASTAAGAGGEPLLQQEQGAIARPGAGPGLGSAPMGFAAYKLNPFAAAAAPTTAGGGGFASSPSKRNPLSELVKGMAAEEGGEEEGGGGEEDVEAEPVNATYLVPKVVHGLKDSSYKPVTGEEEETCVLQLRSKLYRLTEIEAPTKQPSDSSPPSAVSSAAAAAAAAAAAQPPRRDWVECGVGQAKILIPQARESGAEPSAAARVVMRREPGTSVLINARLKPPVVTAAKHADKALRLTCLDEKGQPSTFLFRFKLQDESEQFLAEITRQLEVAGADASETSAPGEAAPAE